MKFRRPVVFHHGLLSGKRASIGENYPLLDHDKSDFAPHRLTGVATFERVSKPLIFNLREIFHGKLLIGQCNGSSRRIPGGYFG